MKAFIKLLGDIMTKGSDDVLETPPFGEVRQLIGSQLRFDLTKGYPLLTTRPQDFVQIRDEVLDIAHRSNISLVAQTVQSSKQDHLIGFNDISIPGLPVRCQIATDHNDLHCILTLDTVDVVNELPRILAVYGLVMRLVSREAVGRHEALLVVNIGRAIVQHKDFKLVNAWVNRKPLKPCKLQFNPERSSFKDAVPDDLTIVDYIYHDEIEDEVEGVARRLAQTIRRAGATVEVSTDGTES